MLRKLFWATFLSFCVLVAFSIYFIRSEEARLDILLDHYPRVNYRNNAENGRRVQVEFTEARPPSWVDMKVVPSWVYGAVLISEDWAFYEHQGFDWKQIRSAFEEWVAGRNKIRGASTISQQLIKNVFLSQDRSWWRKLREAVLTRHLEARFSKDKILELYLNIVEWGPDIVGLREAARYYFDKSPVLLNPREAAFLAFLLPSPLQYSRSYKEKKLTDFARTRIDSILERMLQAQYIQEEQKNYFRYQPFSFEAELGSEELEFEKEEDHVYDESDDSL
jgi:monofunctional glycosyltransferase